MKIVTLITRDLGRAVRDTADSTTSPYLAAALLQRDLQPLHHRLNRLAQQRPDLLAEVADHWNVAPTAPAVNTEVDHRAAALLTRRMDADHTRSMGAKADGRRATGGLPPGPGHHRLNCSP